MGKKKGILRKSLTNYSNLQLQPRYKETEKWLKQKVEPCLKGPQNVVKKLTNVTIKVPHDTPDSKKTQTNTRFPIFKNKLRSQIKSNRNTPDFFHHIGSFIQTTLPENNTKNIIMIKWLWKKNLKMMGQILSIIYQSVIKIIFRMIRLSRTIV